MGGPNLFGYATSELSQDAFISWLLAWADPSHATVDPTLHQTGRRFLEALFARHGTPVPGEVPWVKVHQQRGKIDVLAEIGGHMVLAIEDKVDTGHHSNQLERYKEALDREFPGRAQVLVYLQTYEQCSYADIEAKGWKPFLRKDLLEALRPAAGATSNAILLDFLDHLEGIGRRVGAFAHACPTDWDHEAWRGFFACIQPRLGGTWRYVPNPKGGFMGFWWAECNVKDHTVYLQLEQEQLVVKLAVGEGANRGEVRTYWINRVLETFENRGFARPARLGSGETMTIARFGKDYRVEDGRRVDVDATVKWLLEIAAALRRLTTGGSEPIRGSE